jgi:hypothetical protein
MASPTRYVVSYSFDDFQTANPTIPLPADKLEIELNNLVLTTDEIIDNLNLIQRSDGALTNAIVSFDTLSNDVKTLLGSPIVPRGAWLTATAYNVLDLITQSGSSYLAVSDHTSGVFATDLAADKWILWAASNSITINNSNWSGTDLSVGNGGTGVSTLTGLVKGNGTSAFSAAVQGTDYYAPSGTDVAIADGGTGASTAAGARTNLGLAALAVLSSVNNDNWSGTDLSVGNGGTGGSTAADARTNLDVYSKGETDALIPAVLTPWVAYTPTLTGFGTATGIEFYSRRVGDTLELKGKFTCGTTTAVEARMSLGYDGTNGGITSEGSDKLPSGTSLCGTGAISVASAVLIHTLIERSVGYITFGIQTVSSAGLTKANGTAFSSGQTVSIFASVPIDTW